MAGGLGSFAGGVVQGRQEHQRLKLMAEQLKLRSRIADSELKFRENKQTLAQEELQRQTEQLAQGQDLAKRIFGLGGATPPPNAVAPGTATGITEQNLPSGQPSGLGQGAPAVAPRSLPSGLNLDSVNVSETGHVSGTLKPPKLATTGDGFLIEQIRQLHPGRDAESAQNRMDAFSDMKIKQALAGKSTTTINNNMGKVQPRLLAEQHALTESLQNVVALYDKSFVGPFDSVTGDLLSRVNLANPQFLEFRSNLIMAQLQLKRRALGTAQTAIELKSIFKGIPDLSNSDSQFEANLKVSATTEKRLLRRYLSMSQGQIEANVARNTKLLLSEKIADPTPEGVPANATYVGTRKSKDGKVVDLYRTPDMAENEVIMVTP